QTTLPRPGKRDFERRYTWVVSPRYYDKRTDSYLALDTGGGPLARLWVTALSQRVNLPYVRARGDAVEIHFPKTASAGEQTYRWRIPPSNNTLERNRARTYFQAYAAACALYFLERGLAEVYSGRTKAWQSFAVPQEAVSCGFHEAVRGALSHHLVIRDGLIANYQPYPPTPWNASPRDSFGTPGPYEDAIIGMPLFEDNAEDQFKGIDIMRTVRSFDPCLPCGVHVYRPNGGKLLELSHSPTFGVGWRAS
ncbi:MAG TPA: nickel-dependent hydrogenase large subunit, partial [Polyangiales bacterium]|nr:nickel-dependent hydrogenase large subunit [Polyangiales bacterium]